MSRKITAICLMLVISGCAARMNKIMDSWVGSHYSDLIASWGPPTQVIEDGKGGKIITWSYSNTIYFPGQSTTTLSPYGTTAYTTTSPGISTNVTKYRTFWVNEDGIIYKWSWQGL